MPGTFRLRVSRGLSIAAAVGPRGGNATDNQLIPCVRVDFEKTGERAITALLRQTKSQSKAAPQIERVSGELCVGTTTAKPRRQ
jgi:DNA-binding LacI/PurR family transcriptional regulator